LAGLPNSRLKAAFLLLSVAMASAVSALAQRDPQRGPRLKPSTVIVSVRELNGTPLEVPAFVHLYSPTSSVNLTAPTQERAQAVFSNVDSGDYRIDVTAPGYQQGHEEATVFAGIETIPVYVYLRRESDPRAATPAPGPPILTPKAEKLLRKGLEALKAQRLEEAKADLEKAERLAPGHPDVHYLLGLLFSMQGNASAARGQFEKVLSLDSRHEPALVALGELQLRANEVSAATRTLEDAASVNASAWRTHSLLANAYLQAQDTEKARTHAARAVELGKEQAVAANLLLGRALMLLGKREEARKAFARYLDALPRDPGAVKVKGWLAELDSASAPPPKPAAASKDGAVIALAVPPSVPVFDRPWAPPDIDAVVPTVADRVPCSLEEVLGGARRQIQRLLDNFERFTAKERIEHQEIDRQGNPGVVRAREFDYLAVIARPRPGTLFVEESRDGREALEDFPTGLASRGLAGMAVYLFHPMYTDDFQFTCEGLGPWRGQAAWQVRFEQRADRPSRIRVWRVRHRVFPVKLKGRVWIGANTYQVAHIETELMGTVPEIQLAREHLTIDYGPVQFEHRQAQLWLPWRAELFLEFRGRRYHHRHEFRDYLLYSVDTTHTIESPKKREP
jgi:Flp pilus assembly protein TadD